MIENLYKYDDDDDDKKTIKWSIYTCISET